MRLGDLDRPDRRREPRSRAHPIPDLVEVVPQIGLKLLQSLPVHSGAPLLALTCRHASHTNSLGTTNGLSCDLGLFIFVSSHSSRRG
jgi:hypothetical protein